MKYASAGFVPLGLVALLAFAVPPAVLADPWKDESGKGRKHHEWKDRGKDRDKGFGKARKRLGQDELGRGKWAERRRGRPEHAEQERAWTDRRAIGGGERGVRRRAVTDGRMVRQNAGSPGTRPLPTRATRASTAVVDRAGATGTAADARRRAAVASYLRRHPGS